VPPRFTVQTASYSATSKPEALNSILSPWLISSPELIGRAVAPSPAVAVIVTAPGTEASLLKVILHFANGAKLP